MRPLKILTLATAFASVLVVGFVDKALGDADQTNINTPMFTNAAVSLNNRVVVDDHLIRLGDLFNNAGDKANIAVAYAPKPGKRASFDARWLYKVARAYKLDWRPFSRLTQAVVERDSQIIDRDIIRAEITEALRDKGLEPDMRVQLSDTMASLYVPGESDGSVSVEDVVYRARTGRFTAIVASPADSPTAQRIRISGKVHRMVDVPVLKNRVARGDVITEQDITWVQVKAKSLKYAIIEHESDLIGMTLKRMARPGQPIRASDLTRPLIVKKGEIVTVRLKVGAMSLTTQAKALEGGSRGDQIRVTNTKSNKTLDAIIIGSGLVKVETARQIAMSREN